MSKIIRTIITGIDLHEEKMRNVIGHLDNVAWREGRYECDCPVHPDGTRSLSVKLSVDGSVSLKCSCGCSTTDICFAAGIDPDSLYPSALITVPQKPYRSGMKAEYRYVDEDGRYLYTKRTYTYGKALYVRDDRWPNEYGLDGIATTLYNLPAFLEAARSGEDVFYVESEEDVEKLLKLGYTATTAGSPSSWKPEYVHYFDGAEVTFISHDDEASVAAMRKVMNDVKQHVWRAKLSMVSIGRGHSLSDYLGNDPDDDIVGDALFDWQDQVYPDYIMINCFGEACLKSIPRFAYDLQIENRFVDVGDMSTAKTQTYIYRNGVYLPFSDSSLTNMIAARFSLEQQDPASINKIAKLVKLNVPRREGDELNADESVINFQNGLYDIYSHALRPHDHKALSTIQLPCDYDPEASQPLEFLKFMDSLCTDEKGVVDNEKKALLQEIIGLAISQIYGWCIKSSVLLYSPIGNTGKSVLLDVISQILGEENVCSLSIQDLNGRWATAFAYGKRLICVGDQKSTEVRDSSTFKKITGGDLLKAEKKGRDLFGFKFRGLMLMAANNLPRFKDDTGEHMAERFVIIPCTNVIPADERNPDLREELLKEKQGIILWALEGLDRFLQRGKALGSCQAVETAREEFRKQSDSVYSFISETFDVTGESSDFVKTSEFNKAYKNYCETQELSPIGIQKIPNKIASYKGIVQGTKDGYQVYRGLAWK